MALPNQDELIFPIWRMLQGRQEMQHISSFVKPIEDYFDLTEEERAETVPSNPKEAKVRHRLRWATTALSFAGLITRPKPAFIQLTETGKNTAVPKDMSSKQVRLYLEENFPSYREWRQGFKSNATRKGIESVDLTDASVEALEEDQEKTRRDSVKQELLDALYGMEPPQFERKVLEILNRLGYKGETEHTGKSGDGGIDGVIYQDLLHLSAIALQTKRYELNRVVGPADVNSFIGALNDRRFMGGVFVTTGRFSNEAKQLAVKNPLKPLSLIDGDWLVELMLEHRIGVEVTPIAYEYRLKAEFFE